MRPPAIVKQSESHSEQSRVQTPFTPSHRLLLRSEQDRPPADVDSGGVSVSRTLPFAIFALLQLPTQIRPESLGSLGPAATYTCLTELRNLSRPPPVLSPWTLKASRCSPEKHSPSGLPCQPPHCRCRRTCHLRFVVHSSTREGKHPAELGPQGHTPDWSQS